MWVEVVRNRFSHGAALTPISIHSKKFMTGLDFSKKRVEGLAFLVLGWSPYVSVSFEFLLHAASVLFFTCLSHATARNFVERMQ